MAALSIMGIFLFPTLQGPYSAVHGPVSALLSIRAAARLRSIIVRAGLTALGDLLYRSALALKSFAWAAQLNTVDDLNSLPAGFCTVLRC